MRAAQLPVAGPFPGDELSLPERGRPPDRSPQACPSQARPRRDTLGLPGWGLLLAALLALALAALATTPARAAVIMGTTLSNTPQDSRIMLLDIGSGSGNGLINNTNATFGGSNSLSFAGTSGIYHGNVSGVAAAPVLDGSQITSNYFAAEPSGSITFQFGTAMRYFGLLWGSVDTYNTLSFYNGNSLVKSYTGSQITANPVGSQAADGSFFVTFDFTSSSKFTRVVVSTTSPAFEFNAVSYSTMDVDVVGPNGGTPTTVLLSTNALLPAPGEAALLPGLLLLALLRPWRGRGGHHGGRQRMA